MHMHHVAALTVGGNFHDGIESVKKNAPLAERYERLTSKNGKHYFT